MLRSPLNGAPESILNTASSKQTTMNHDASLSLSKEIVKENSSSSEFHTYKKIHSMVTCPLRVQMER